MERRLVLHVGTPKSGTTHLQAILAAGRDRLARSGILYPGARHLPQRGFNQQPAIYALAGTTIGWADEQVRQTSAVYLARLCEELATHRGRALVSAESLAFFEEPQARLLLDRLGYDPSSVTVVITARDLGRILPSIWQQNVKNGTTEAMQPYLDSVASLRDQPGVAMWTAFGLPGLVERWSQIVGADHVVMVTSPHRHSETDVLWQRFAAAAGIPHDLPAAAPAQQRADHNLSVTVSQAELIRGLNIVLQADGYTRDRQQQLRGRLLRIWMNLPPAAGQRPAVPQHLHEVIRGWARQDIGRLDDQRVRVVGSLADLEPQFQPSPVPTRHSSIDPDTARDILALLEHGTQEEPVRHPARWRTWLSRPAARIPRPRRHQAQPTVAVPTAAAPANPPHITIDLSQRQTPPTSAHRDTDSAGERQR